MTTSSEDETAKELRAAQDEKQSPATPVDLKVAAIGHRGPVRVSVKRLAR